MTERTPKITEAISMHDDDLEVADNWLGLSDPAERRRRQNRINQRAYRKLLFALDNRQGANIFQANASDYNLPKMSTQRA
jgi:hypothetical protein